MARKTTDNAASRRAFFRVGLLAIGAAGTVAMVKLVAGAEAAPVATAKTTGYRETEHVKKVYAAARF